MNTSQWFNTIFQEITVIKDEATLYCTVWNQPDSLHGFIVWILFVVVPIILGPVLTTIMEIIHYIAKKCATTPFPPTPSLFLSWVTIHLMSIVTMSTYTLHLWLVESSITRQFGLDYFTSLILKYYVGNLDIMLIPMIALCVDSTLRNGLVFMMTAKKKGILSKTNSVYSEYM